MAEEAPKPDRPGGDEEKKEGSSPSNSQFFSELFFLLLFLFIIGKWFSSRSAGGVFGQGQTFSISSALERLGIEGYLYRFMSVYVTLANILSLFFAIVIIYSLVQIVRIQRQWYAKLYPGPALEEQRVVKNDRWQAVLAHINSDNPSDLRLAILECDIILDDLLDREGYVGDTIGDKLKQADKGEFRTLDDAWEAHKIRNAIAHEGQGFVLTAREAKRVVNLYESVFREFDFV